MSETQPLTLNQLMALPMIEGQDTLYAALRAGIGFSAACRSAALHPMQVTELFHQNPNFKRLLEYGLETGVNRLINMANEALTAGAFKPWKTLCDTITKRKNLALWGSLGQGWDTPADTVEAAILALGDLSEAATALAMEEHELWEWLSDNPDVRLEIKRAGILDKNKKK